MDDITCDLFPSTIWTRCIVFIHLLLFVLLVFSLQSWLLFSALSLLILNLFRLYLPSNCGYEKGDKLRISDGEPQYQLLTVSGAGLNMNLMYATSYLTLFRPVVAGRLPLILLADSMKADAQRKLRLSIIDSGNTDQASG